MPALSRTEAGFCLWPGNFDGEKGICSSPSTPAASHCVYTVAPCVHTVKVLVPKHAGESTEEFAFGKVSVEMFQSKAFAQKRYLEGAVEVARELFARPDVDRGER